MSEAAGERRGLEPDRRGPLILAHRGDHRSASENSLDAFRSALGIPGIDGVELDVRGSADGVAILLHDSTLARVQGRSEAARALSAAELARVDVPSLDALLAVARPPAFLDVELKEDVVEAVVAAVGRARGDPPFNVVLSSFEAPVLERLASVAPSWPRWLNADRLDLATLDLAGRLGCSAVSARWRSIDEDSVATAMAAGLDVAAWTVTTIDEVHRLARLGVVAICVEGEALSPS